MQHVKEINLSAASYKTSESAQDSTRPLKVWAQLAEMFSNAFLRENGDEPPKLWVQAIGRLSDRQIATGLAELGNQGLAFPPNLSQFIAACKTQVRKPNWDVKALPPSSEAESKANAERAWRDMERLAGRPLRNQEIGR